MVVSLLQYCECMSVKECKCPLCFNRKKKEIILHNVFETAADGCLLLVWFKIMDSIHDKERMLYRLLYYVFKNKIQNILNSSTNIKSMEERYLKVIYLNDIETIVEETGIAAKSIYLEMLQKTEISNECREQILPIADLYGRIIALADPVIDFKNDMKKHKQSPLNSDNIEHYTQVLVNLMNYGKTFVVELENKKITSLYFQNLYMLSCYNIESQINQIW